MKGQFNININGKSYSGSGSISIKNGKVTIDGKPLEEAEQKEVNITIEGDVTLLHLDYGKVIVNGSVGQIETASGDVEVHKDVTGKYIKTTSGNVEVSGNVHGDIDTTSGDVKCGQVTGSVKTVSGDIKNRV